WRRSSLSGGTADILLDVDAPGPGVIPLAGDWDGDGKTTVGLYDPATSTFYLKNRLSGRGFDVVLAFGPAGGGWLPLAGDWDGDGKTTGGLYHTARGHFSLKNSPTRGISGLPLRLGHPPPSRLPISHGNARQPTAVG